MVRFVLKRLLGMVAVLLSVATLSFFMMHSVPGGPFDSERQLPDEILKNINSKYHLDEPLGMQYMRYMGMLLQGDLGPSFRYPSRTVNEIIVDTFPISAMLGLSGLFFALIIGLFFGLLASSKPNSLRDYVSMIFATLGICLPSFVIGPVFVLFFAVKWDIFNVAGYDEAKDLVLPALTMGTMYAAFFARLSRAGVLDIRSQDFVKTAMAKGVRKRTILFRHVLRGGLLPVVSFLGPAVAAMLTGSLVVETIFNIPGLGRFFVQSALNRDYTLVMGCVLFVAVLITLCNLLVDIVYAVLDPRVRYE